MPVPSRVVRPNRSIPSNLVLNPRTSDGSRLPDRHVGWRTIVSVPGGPSMMCGEYPVLVSEVYWNWHPLTSSTSLTPPGEVLRTSGRTLGCPNAASREPSQPTPVQRKPNTSWEVEEKTLKPRLKKEWQRIGTRFRRLTWPLYLV